MQPFVHLHVHSYYSVLDGQASLKGLINKAYKDGMPGIALTDHGVMFGIKSFVNEVDKLNGSKRGEIKDLKAQLAACENEEDKEPLRQSIAELEHSLFKPIIGCEVYCARRTRHDKDKNVPNPYRPSRSIDESGYHLILLAKNHVGYKNLIKLVSLGATEGYYYRPRVDKELLHKYNEGIIALSACLGGEVPQHILAGRIDRAKETILEFKKLYGEDYYLEVQLHKTDNPLANCETWKHQMRVNEVIYQLAEELGVKVVATNDVHFVNEEDGEAHDRLICLSTSKSLDDPNRMRYSKQEWLKTTEEMNAVFSDHPEVLACTMEIFEKVERYSISSPPLMPDFPLPEGFDTAQDYLHHLTYEGAHERYGEELSAEVQERIDFELETISSMGFPGYFLIVWDFINQARKMGVSVGPGRGSAAGCAVAYALKITNIDPIKYGLLFERFLNPDRRSMPDIDVDFDDEGRESVLAYVRDKYGKERVARIITFGTMAAKSAIKDVARVEQLPLDKSDYFAKLVPDRIPDVKKVTLHEAIKHVPELRDAALSGDKIVKDTLQYAEQLEGTVRNTGVHACGVIIAGQDISDVVPVALAVDKKAKEPIIITQYQGEVIEDTGLIKMDFLGLQTLSIINETLKNIKLRHNIDLDVSKVTLEDEETYKLFSRGDTGAIFQFESNGMREYLRQLQPTHFLDIIAMNALYRPGPMDSIPSFIARKHGREKITYQLPEMEPILKETYGITVYQEQVMLLSRLLANFTRGQSDDLRKGMGKKKLELLEPLEAKFLEQGVANGHPYEVLREIWDEWIKFASYAFNKSHAAGYAWLAYQTAYLKAHFPSEFMAGNLSCMLDKASEVVKLMGECKEMGINVLSPDVNESENKFTVNKKGDIRFGLGAIKGVSSSGVEDLLQERREHGLFVDVYNLVERLPTRSLNRKTFEAFVLSGALDSFGLSREVYFAPPKAGVHENFLMALLAYGKEYQTDNLASVNSLFGEMTVAQLDRPEPTSAPEWSEMERLSKERALIGRFVSGNPLAPYEFVLRYCCTVNTQDLQEQESLVGKKLVFAGLVSKATHGTTRKGHPMGRLEIEDLEGKVELTLYQRNYLDFANYLREGIFVLVEAAMERPPWRDTYEIKVTNISLLSEVAETLIKRITLRMDIDALTERFVDILVEGVASHPGSAELTLELVEPEGSYKTKLAPRKNGIEASTWLLPILEEYHIDCKVE